MKRILSCLFVMLLLLVPSPSLAFGAELELEQGDLPSSWAQADSAEAKELGIVPQELDSAYGQAGIEGIAFSDCQDEAVLFCAANQIVSGVGNGKFGPEQNIERQVAVRMLQGAWALVKKPPQGPLTQALPGGVATDATSGAALANTSATALESHMPHVFADGRNINAWAREGVTWAYREGIAAGTSENRFDPTEPYTREQAAVMVLKLY